MSKVMSGIRVSRSILASVIVLAVLTAAPGHASHGAGSITALAIDPLSPSIVYAGTVDGGVFKSTDGGESWRATGLAGTRITALAIDPLNPNTLFVGTHDYGIFKTIDGGATWSMTFSACCGPIDDLAIDPFNPNVVYAGATFVYKSIDGGASWSSTALGRSSGLGDNVQVLAIDPMNPSTVYAGTNLTCDLFECAGGGGVSITVDSGASWSATGLTDYSVWTLAIAPRADPLGPITLYAGFSGQGFGMVKSADGGASWTWTGLDTWVEQVAVDPTTPTIVYAVTLTGMFKSTDAGTTWNAIGFDSAGTLALNPQDPAELYAGTGRAVFKSTDGGANWSPTGPIPPPDTVAPDTSIGSVVDGNGGSVPNGGVTQSNAATVVFTGTDNEAVAGFECRVDGASFTSCTSPATYSGLGVGRHDFEVRAVDSAGNLDGTPALYSWTIDSPPETTITSAIDRQGNPIPNGGTTRSNVIAFSFTGMDNVSVTGFECSLDGAAFAACESPITYTAVSRGSHTFRVRAVDTNAFRDATPAYFVWTR